MFSFVCMADASERQHGDDDYLIDYLLTLYTEMWRILSVTQVTTVTLREALVTVI